MLKFQFVWAYCAQTGFFLVFFGEKAGEKNIIFSGKEENNAYF